MKGIGYNIVSICLLAIAAYLIYLDREGWGWCVFAALLVSVSPTGSDEDEEN